MKKSKIKRINLLPKEYIQAQKIKKYILIAAMLILFESIVFVGLAVVPPIRLKKHEQNVLLEIERMKNDVRFSEVKEVLNQLETSKKDLDLWSKAYQEFKKDSFIDTLHLDILTSRLPNGLTIDQLELLTDQQTIKITGKIQSPEALLNYVMILEMTFKEAQVDFKAQQAKEKQTYTIDIIFPKPVTTQEASNGGAQS